MDTLLIFIVLIERPLHSLEHILAVQKPDSYLCIKPNTFADKLLHYVSVKSRSDCFNLSLSLSRTHTQDDAYKGQCIQLHVQEKKKWRKCPCCVRDNSFVIYKDSKVSTNLVVVVFLSLHQTIYSSLYRINLCF